MFANNRTTRPLAARAISTRTPGATKPLQSTSAFFSKTPRLPLIDLIERIIPATANGGPDFSEAATLSSQHLLPNTKNVLKYLMNCGLKPKTTVATGKCYSNHAQTIKDLREMGFSIIESERWQIHDGFDATFDTACRKSCATFVNHLEPGQLPIVIDDGGRLNRELRTGHSEEPKLKNMVITEQTNSGLPATETGAAPVIRLCDSFIKSIAEPPLVAAASFKKAQEAIATVCKEQENLKESKNDNKKTSPGYRQLDNAVIGVVGLGTIGYKLVKLLVKHNAKQIAVWDINAKKVEDALKLGVPLETHVSDSMPIDSDPKPIDSHPQKTQMKAATSIQDLMKTCHIVLSAVGKPIILEGEEERYDAAKPTILISFSSAQNDFLPLIKYARHNAFEKARKAGMPYEFKGSHHDTLYIQNGWEGVYAIPRYGTPITFDNSEEAMPNHHAQLVRALIIGSSIQATEMSKDKRDNPSSTVCNTHYKLSPLWQFFVANCFLSLLPESERREFYSAEEEKQMRNIDLIAEKSNGTLYEPFEKKLRIWLDPWLKANRLTDQVDNWLNSRVRTEYARPALVSRL
jgi:hypothetical protein